MDKLLKFNNKLIKSGNSIVRKAIDPLNPLNLPPNTVRVRTNDGNVPTKTNYTTYDTATLVPGTTDLYDVYKSGNNFYALFWQSSNVVEVLGANTNGITHMGSMFMQTSVITVSLFDTSNVTKMGHMFSMCPSLTSVPLFDTSNVTDMKNMFSQSTSLTFVPLFNTSNVNNVNSMFSYCTNVQSGALALYQQLSTQTNPPTNHTGTFSNCGTRTQTGAAELAQIPDDWK